MLKRIVVAGLMLGVAAAFALLANAWNGPDGSSGRAEAGPGDATPTATPLHGCQVGSVKLSYPFDEPAILDVSCPNILPPGLGHWTVDVSFDTVIVAAKGCQTTAPTQGEQSCSVSEDSVRFLGDATAGTGTVTLGNITFSCLTEGISDLTLHIVRLEDVTQRPIGTGAVNGYVDCNGVPVTPTPPLANGDVNKDGTTDSVDALLVLQYRAGVIAHLPHADNADVNQDRSIDAIDALLILQYDVGLINELPV